jgi:DNA polymerase alpha subunit A
LYNQLLYLQGMFDVDKTMEKMAKNVVKNEENEKVKILAGMNRERLAVCGDVVRAFLDKSGWGWVSMEGLFRYAQKQLV